jgi:hypothetical protein
MGRMRADPGIVAPTRDLAGFPIKEMTGAAQLFRAVTTGRTPWWFGSDGSQRFDVPPPGGTCYVGLDIPTAIREKGRRAVLSTGKLDPDFLASFDVYELRLPSKMFLADSTKDAAVDFGANRELATALDYTVTCQWAAAFVDAGFDGLLYTSRYTSGMEPNAVAVFNDHGDAGWPHVRKIAALEAVIESGLDHMLLTHPTSAKATMATPPLRKKP